MSNTATSINVHHNNKDVRVIRRVRVTYEDANKFTYTFTNFFHPFVGELITRLNTESLKGLLEGQLDPALKQDFFEVFYKTDPNKDELLQLQYFPKEIDVSRHGPYSSYNWELFFHVPFTIAVHLSKTQRFSEAQRWFHFIFDPTANDQSVPPLQRFWKFLAFRQTDIPKRIEDIVRILSIPDSELTAEERSLQLDILNGYFDILKKPFQPHAVARTRFIAYQYAVVMKYLDNLIAWGDQLFRQDTIESINEASQVYILAANILGEQPQEIPAPGKIRPKSYAQLKKEGIGPIGDALVDLEIQFPFNLTASAEGSSNGNGNGNSLFGMGRSLYFCIPRNEKLLGYWDTVGDRLYKIRHCMNISGVVRQLALFDPPIDPGMLVKAAAAGLDISSMISGLNQPIGPVRSLFLIQKALELCGEVRNLGTALLSALEKGDAEHLSLVRQKHEVQIQQMTKEVRFLQWKSAQETTTSLLTSRATALERLRNYQRLLGLPADQNIPSSITLDRRRLTEENFDEAFTALVSQYQKNLTIQNLPALKLAGDTSPSQQAGAAGKGRLYLNANEDIELNQHLPTARDMRLAANVSSNIAGILTFIPDFNVDLHFWGIGASTEIFGGKKLSDALKFASEIFQTISAYEQDQAGMAGRRAGYERRADDWLFQYNLAAHELMQIGRQVLTSLITEQVAQHEYQNIEQQIANSQEVDQLLHEKFTNEELHLWMQGEISRLYYEYYRFAFDTARKAEKTMKQEMMRPELDAQDFVKFNYWDGGRKGLLSGEALQLDVKRMEMAYHENNMRDLELTRNVSLRQLNPVALLALKMTGTCQLSIPEWFYDLGCPGHYMRRIKSVGLSIPCVVGPYTNVNCTLSLLKSSIRKSSLPKDGEYARQGREDDRFIDYIGAVQSIVTSGAMNDTGLYETNLKDERFLPFEGAGAESIWKLELPKDYRSFDYDTISDAILHIRYTARQGVNPVQVKSALDDIFSEAGKSGLALLFSLRGDFQTEWATFLNGQAAFTATIRKDFFPYFTQNKAITINGFEIYSHNLKHHMVGNQATWDAATDDLGDTGLQKFTVSIPADAPGPLQVLTRTTGAKVFLIVRYSLSN